MDEKMQRFYAALAKRAESEDYYPIDMLPLPRESDADVEAFLERAIADAADSYADGSAFQQVPRRSSLRDRCLVSAARGNVESEEVVMETAMDVVRRAAEGEIDHDELV